MRNAYFHGKIPDITADFLNEGSVLARGRRKATASDSVDVALMAMRLAVRLGVRPPAAGDGGGLPYDEEAGGISFESPLLSLVAGKPLRVLRGWPQFESCVKGFNSLGLMAEHVVGETRRLRELDAESLGREKRAFLSTRKVFAPAELEALTVGDLTELSLVDLALWNCFARRTIVCSTSSNMGISLHRALRSLQRTSVSLFKKTFPLFAPDEGGLVIWCPDENADFMNKEKSRLLRALASEQPALTTLRTYINRQQRDPGALRDALLCGGYFFPTNPLSVEEVQNLLFVSLNQIAAERKAEVPDLLRDEKIRTALASLGCEIEREKILVDAGVEGGISGLMLPYLIMLEEALGRGESRALSAWNQASIGAALAAAVRADGIVRDPSVLSERTRGELNSLFPNISRFLDDRRLGRDLKTSIHGVFDVANLQSLAQLLGVVVERHLSGRGTAYVGLGSSSYSNGNRCYEILRESIEARGAFRGRADFHPATHTLNPFSQALIYGEDFLRAVAHPSFAQKPESARVGFIRAHVKKPEPAGAAAVAGYLLARLDNGTLSIVEIAYALRLVGFTKPLFLEFCGLRTDGQGLNQFLQESYEEGVYMGDLAKNILLMLDWSLEKIERRSAAERAHSALKCRLHPLDEPEIDNLNPEIHLYLTGDNTAQPSDEFIGRLLAVQSPDAQASRRRLESGAAAALESARLDRIALTSRAFTFALKGLGSLEDAVRRLMKTTLSRQVASETRKLDGNGSDPDR